jgi:hypothetical protein
MSMPTFGINLAGILETGAISFWTVGSCLLTCNRSAETGIQFPTQHRTRFQRKSPHTEDEQQRQPAIPG